MNKAEVINGLNMAIKGLETLRDAVQSDSGEAKTSAPASTKPAIGGKGKAPATAPKGKVAGKTTPAPAQSNSETYTMAELTGMKYNEFKKLAASLGVDCKGTREEIMARVVDLGVVTDADSAPASAPAKTSAKPAVGGAKSGKSAPVGKGNAKKADAPAGDEFDAQAKEIIETTSAEDIISALADVGVKASKLNYKAQLVKALREGKLAVGDDEENSEEAGGEDMVAEDYYADYDLSEANDPEKMSEARSAACIGKQDAIISEYAEGKLTADDIVEYLQTVCVQEELDLLGDEYTEEDLLKLYIEVAKHFIDGDGEEHEPGEAYMIDDETAFCCGQPLNYDEATNKFLCSHCAGEYEAG